MFRTKQKHFALKFFVVLALSILSFSNHAFAQTVIAEIPVVGASGIDVNPNTNLIYTTTYNDITGVRSRITTIDGNTNTVINSFEVPSIYPPQGQGISDVKVNPSANTIYAIYGDTLIILDAQSHILLDSNVGDGYQTAYFGQIAVDPVTGLAYYLPDYVDSYALVLAHSGYPGESSGYAGIAVNRNTRDLYFATRYFDYANPVPYGLFRTNFANPATISGDFEYLGEPCGYPDLGDFVAVNAATDRVFISCPSNIRNLDGRTGNVLATIPVGDHAFHLTTNESLNHLYFLMNGSLYVVDGDTNVVKSIIPLGLPQYLYRSRLAVNPVNNRIYVTNSDSNKVIVLQDAENAPVQTSTGTNVTIQANSVALTFGNVESAGTTSVTPIDPATAGDVPGGFAVSESAFEVSTTATFTGSVTTCFNVPTVNDQTEFNNLRVLHREGTVLVDRTTSHDFGNRKICATTTSFSPFYLAKVGNNLKLLFDRSRAFRVGSTIPVKLQLMNASNQNISSSNIQLAARGLRRIGTNTTSTVTDAGNSNPDFNFRYDSSLQGYIYNLKTTGLSAGKYVLSFYTGPDHSFFYTVEFEVR